MGWITYRICVLLCILWVLYYATCHINYTHYTGVLYFLAYKRTRLSPVALRAKDNATYLPSVYDKVKVVDVAAVKRSLRESWLAWLLALFGGIRSLNGIYGVLHAVSGVEYLLPRQYPWKIEPKGGMVVQHMFA
jgi:hypothetical protein